MEDRDVKNKIINEKLRVASGKVEFPASDWLTNFLYLVLRDCAPAGKIESAVRDVEQDSNDGNHVYSNGWLANYAKHLADRLDPQRNKEIK